MTIYIYVRGCHVGHYVECHRNLYWSCSSVVKWYYLDYTINKGLSFWFEPSTCPNLNLLENRSCWLLYRYDLLFAPCDVWLLEGIEDSSKLCRTCDISKISSLRSVALVWEGLLRALVGESALLHQNTIFIFREDFYRSGAALTLPKQAMCHALRNFLGRVTTSKISSLRQGLWHVTRRLGRISTVVFD